VVGTKLDLRDDKKALKEFSPHIISRGATNDEKNGAIKYL